MQAFPLTRNLAIAAGNTNGRPNAATGPGSTGLFGSSTTPDKKIVISPEEWENRLSRTKLSKSDINKLVMNYLSTEGYKEAAENFALETGTKSPVDLQSIDDRMIIREAIQKGDIEKAIGLINDVDPEILDYNPKIVFHLAQQQMIEMIRNGELEKALIFAQEDLAPKGEANPEFLIELEKTMTLLVLDPKQHGGELFDPYHRVKVANEVNAAILQSQGFDQGAKLPVILKLLMWSQDQLATKANFPRITNLADCSFQLENTEMTD